jgi:itaconate CoA-transferase
VLANPAYSGNPQRVALRKELGLIIENVFHSLTGEQLVARLDKAEIANALMNDMHAVWDHPQLHARDRWTEIDSPVGKLRALFPPGMSREDDPQMGAVPSLGQHTDIVLRDLGFDFADIKALKTAGAV